MRRAVLAFSLLSAVTIATGCRTASSGSQLRDTFVTSYEDDLGMRPAVGLDGILEDVRGECIDHDGLEQTGTGQEAVYQVRMVESHKDLFAELGVTAASHVKAAVPDPNFQVGRKTKFALGTTFGISRYSLYVLVAARVRNQTAFLKNPRIKDEVKQALAANAETGVDQFRTRCGDSFLIGSSSGGEYYALIEVNSATDQATVDARARFRNAVPQSAQGGATAAQLDAGLRAAASGASLRVWTYQRGGAGEDEIGLVTTPDEIMTRLKRLADSAREGQNPRPLTATFSDYFTLGAALPATYRTKLENAKDTVKRMSEALSALLDLRADLDYIVSRPTTFVGVDAAKLQQIDQTKARIVEIARRINEAGKQCAKSYADCKAPDDMAAPAFELPRRKPTLDQLANERVRIKSKLNFVDVNALYDGWFNPPECYVAVKVGRYSDDANITVMRTETGFGPSADRCKNVETELSVSVEVIKDAYRQLGVNDYNGWLEFGVFEDDQWYDDHIGSAYVNFPQLQNGAQYKGINHSAMNVEVGFELQY